MLTESSDTGLRIQQLLYTGTTRRHAWLTQR